MVCECISHAPYYINHIVLYLYKYIYCLQKLYKMLIPQSCWKVEQLFVARGVLAFPLGIFGWLLLLRPRHSGRRVLMPRKLWSQDCSTCFGQVSTAGLDCLCLCFASKVCFPKNTEYGIQNTEYRLPVVGVCCSIPKSLLLPCSPGGTFGHAWLTLLAKFSVLRSPFAIPPSCVGLQTIFLLVISCTR